MTFQSLFPDHPWPETRPALPEHWHGWCDGWLQEQIRASLEPWHFCVDAVAVELGSWCGCSTRCMLDCFAGRVISVDTWEGSVEHRETPEWSAMLPTLHQQWQANLWTYRDRLVGLCMTTLRGLQAVRSAGVTPVVILIDAAHDAVNVALDLATSVAMFPTATIIGDDWTYESVRHAVEAYCAATGAQVEPHGNSWRLRT